MNGKGNPGFVPLTARELKNMHGLSVEEGLRQGYCIEGHVKEYQKLHAAMLAQERRALATPGYGHSNYRDRYKHTDRKRKKAASEADTSKAAQSKISQVYDITKSEECQMENTENIRTRLALVLCLMESPLFAETDNDLKLEMLSQLLYDQPLTAEADAPKADKPKRPCGRPKKAAEKKDGETE